MLANRRNLFQKLLSPLASLAGVDAAFAHSTTPVTSPSANAVTTTDDVPLYSSMTKTGNLIFIFGIGAHFDGDIKAHTDHVLKEMEKELIKAGTSMEKVLKVSVFLHDLKDYKGMNEVYKGRFGSKPPVRTTVAPRAGVPGNSLVEMDCIAYV